METRMIIQYLQDIVDLETQKRIAGNTYNQLLILEKDYAYVNYASLEEKAVSSQKDKKIRWIPLIGKLYLAIIPEGLVALLLKWTIIFTIGLLIDIAPEAIEKFSMIICILVGSVWIIRREILRVKASSEQEKKARIQYIEQIKKGKIILAQIQRDKPRLRQVYDECEQNLKKLYFLNIIHYDYRYLEACGMFLQYLRTGRTHCLEQSGGDVGAYNLYENDLKFNVIRNQLNQVLQNQQVLYNALSEINSNVKSLSDSVVRIEQYAQQTEKNTRISAWCNAATAVNTHALRRMQEDYILYGR